MKSTHRIRRTAGVLLAAALFFSFYAAWAEETATIVPAQLSMAALSSKPVVEIREKMFIAQFNDIFLNLDQYMDSVFKYQGIFGDLSGSDSGPYYFVYRNSPGCCGADGVVGFEVIWDKPYPPERSWVEAVGTLERYEEWGNTYLRLRLASLTELAERGLEFVTQ